MRCVKCGDLKRPLGPDIPATILLGHLLQSSLVARRNFTGPFPHLRSESPRCHCCKPPLPSRVARSLGIQRKNNHRVVKKEGCMYVYCSRSAIQGFFWEYEEKPEWGPSGAGPPRWKKYGLRSSVVKEDSIQTPYVKERTQP